MQLTRLMQRLFVLLMPLLATAIPQSSHAQSVDCRKAETATEWAICNTPDLGQLDDQLARTYHRLMASANRTAAIKKEAQQTRVSWIHGRRDLCGGDVGCLTKAYHEIIDGLDALPFSGGASPAQDVNPRIVPDCGAPRDINGPSSRAKFAEVVCAHKDLLETLRRIETLAGEVRRQLTPSWRTAFDAQEAAFPGMPDGCDMDGEKLAPCVAEAVRRRLQDVEDFAAYLGKPVPDCTASDVSIKDSGLGDAGMSQTINGYLIVYSGRSACRIRGYPAIRVFDAKGTPLPTYASYSGSTYFGGLATPPLPVVLSPKNRAAWFAIHNAYACQSPTRGLAVKIALPRSQTWLQTLTFPNANCPVEITPVGMVSTLRSSLR